MDAYLVAKATGLPPWAFGESVPRRRFYKAAVVLSRYIAVAECFRLGEREHRCPLLGEE